MHKPGRRARMQSAFLPRLAQDTSGNVLPLTAGALVVMLALVGGAVDMGGAYKVQRRLQAACDAGVLAGRRAVGSNGFDRTALAQANLYFNNNFDEGRQESSNTVFTPTTPDNGNTIKATATTQAKALIMKVFGYRTMNLKVNCSASMGVGNSDVTFVLDTTGSMAYNVNNGSPTSTKPSKISSLRASMKNFYTTVKNAAGSSNARVRYAFVPYSSTVNVGRVLNDTNPAYLADTMQINSWHFVNWSGIVRTWTGTDVTDPDYTDWAYVDTSTSYSTSTSCSNAKPADKSWSNSGQAYQDTSVSIDSTTGQQVTATGLHQRQTDTEYQCHYSTFRNAYYIRYRAGTRTQSSFDYTAKDEIPVTTAGASYADVVYQRRSMDTSQYKKFVTVSVPMGSSSGRTSNLSYTWNGCIEERQTVAADAFTFDSLQTGIKPTGAYDLDIDMVPTSDTATQWKPMWWNVYAARSSYAIKYSKTATKIDPDDAPACPTAARLLAETTQADFNAYADSLKAEGGTYHDIGLIWGARFSSPTGIFASNVNTRPSNGGSVSRHLIFMTDGDLDPDPNTYTAYGVESREHRVTPNGTDAEQVVRHRSRFLAVCEAIKARGIRLWVIAFGTTLSNDLKTCATTDSSFQADDESELDTEFQKIAKQVGELRITQ